MPLLPFARQTGNRAGFTLVELLVVITIIAILAGISLSAFGTVQNRARKVQAVSDMRSIKTAIVAYYSDYRKYPINDLQAQAALTDMKDAVYGDPGGAYHSADLFNILRAFDDNSYNKDNKLNSNQTVYWPGGFAKNATKPVNGITTKDVTVNGNLIFAGSMVDPWGNQYVVLFDAYADGDLTTAFQRFYADIPVAGMKTAQAPQGMAFVSLGPDGMWGNKGNAKLTNSDDIIMSQ